MLNLVFIIMHLHCVHIGTEVLGIWPKYSQVNDVNATDVSFDHNVIVTGDDFGLVKLFRYPTVKKGNM